MTPPETPADGYYIRPVFSARALRILAGPRFDALRFNMLTYHVVDPKVFSYAEQLLELRRARPKEFQGAALDTLWPQFIDPWRAHYPDDGRSNPPHPIGWRQRLDEPHNPFGLSPSEVGARLRVSAGEKLMTLNSHADGPGCLVIKSRSHPNSRIHPVMMDLHSSWIWGFDRLEDAVMAAVEWWQAAGVLLSAAREAVLDPGQHKVTRADVCVDHECRDQAWSHEDSNPARWVTRARSINGKHPPTEVQQKSGLTIYIGKRGGGGVCTRIYNKTAQLGDELPLATAPKIWRRNGWDGKASVWRCEFEFGSTVLSSIQRDGIACTSLQALDAHELWVEAVRRYRHIDPGKPKVATARWVELTLAGVSTQPYLRSSSERRRGELELALRRVARDLDRCFEAGAQRESIQLLVDARWTKDQDED